MDFCDSIVNTKHAEVSSRHVVGEIVVSYSCCRLLYLHPASAEIAGRWMILGIDALWSL